MTKAKARERAKARAARGGVKRETGANQPGQKIKPGQFDPGSGSIKGPMMNANTRSFTAAKRGSARSR